MDQNCLESLKRGIRHTLSVEFHIKCTPAKKLTDEYSWSVIDAAMALTKHANCRLEGDNLALLRLLAIDGDGNCPYTAKEMTARLQSRGINPPTYVGDDFFSVLRVATTLVKAQEEWLPFAAQRHEGDPDSNLNIPALLGYSSLTT